MTRLSSEGAIVYHPMEDQLAGLLCSGDFHLNFAEVLPP